MTDKRSRYRGAPVILLAAVVGAAVVMSAYGLIGGPAELSRQALEVEHAAAQRALDFEYYRENVEPIFMRPRGGYVAGQTACVNCHTWQATTPLKLEPLEEDGGRAFWTEEQSRRNFEVVSRLVLLGNPEESRLLRKPLAFEAGGAGDHTGGIFWESQNDPEWRVIAEWVRSASPTAMAAPPTPTLDLEFFQMCVQPIFINPIENAVACAECHSGSGERSFANRFPEGRDYWTEEESRLSLAALSQLIEPGYPEYSRFLYHPLHPDAGGDFMHNGGRRWMTADDPERQALAEWIRGEATGSTCPAALQF